MAAVTRATLPRSSSKKDESRRSGFDGSIVKFLEQHVLFKTLDISFLNTLANLMQTRVYNDNDYIVRKGEVGRAMFFILRGIVEVVSEDGETVINVMDEESFFGEIGVLFSVPRTATCRARGRCIILTLTKDALKRAVADNPSAATTIANIAEERFASYMKQKEGDIVIEFGEELKLGMDHSDLKKIPLFRDCEVGFLHMLTLTLKPVQYRQGSLIIHKDDIASEMFFVVSGTCEVFSEHDNTVYAEFHPGSFFGEVGVFFQVKRTASVRCTSNQVTLFKLTKKDLDTLLEQYPEIDEKIKGEAQQRFQYNEDREKAKLNSTQEVETEVEVVRERLKNVPLFKEGSIGFLHSLALRLKLRVYDRSTIIIQKGSVGRSMYFLIDGEAQVISDDGSTVYAELKPSSFFGEVALFYEVSRTATVRASTKLTLFELDKSDLGEVLDQHPQLQETMKKTAEENWLLFQKRKKAVEKIVEEKEEQDAEEGKFDILATAERLKKVPFFQKTSEGFARTLALLTSVHSHKQDTLIVHKGEIASEMFFIVSGSAEVVSDDGTAVYDTLRDGDFFGEVGLIRGIARTASVKVASATCDVIVLTSQALQKVLEAYPDSYQVIALEADKRFHLTEQRKIRTGPEGAKVTEVEEPRTMMDTEHVRQTVGPALTMGEGGGGGGTIGMGMQTKRGVSGLDFSTEGKKAAAAKDKGKKQTGLGRMFKPKEKEERKEEEKKGDEEKKKSGLFGRVVEEVVTASRRGSRTSITGSTDVLPVKEVSLVAGQPEEKPHALPTEKSTLNKVLKSLKISLKPHKVRPTGSPAAASPTSTIVPSSILSETLGPTRRPKPTINSLYDQELRPIFLHLNPITRFAIRQVCKKWRTLLRNPQLWTSLDFYPVFNIVSSLQITRICADYCGDQITSLNLHSCWQLFDDTLLRLTESCPSLKKLNISNCWKLTDKGVYGVAHNLPALEDLDMSFCGQVNGSGCKEHVWSGMKRLNLTYCKQITDEHLEKILCRTSEIVELQLRRCTRISDFGLFLVVRYCRYIKQLDISDCEQISDRCLKWIASSCYNLSYLNLTFCTRITNGGLYDLSLGCQTFTHLDLSHCAHITDAAIALFNDSIQSLEYLSLRRCRKITDGVASYLARCAPKLKTLDVTGCPHVTQNSKAVLEGAIAGCMVLYDVPAGERGIYQPGENGKPKAIEMAFEERFLSGPGERMKPGFGKSKPISVHQKGKNRKRSGSVTGGRPAMSAG
ncbi:hypothetical protein HK097_008814 [Rhizophlyctis rosea]|uniref:Cyclic nucleotide-binding domain-containing protein n=1 Tax=Rhizophlyctis rosea TaxID=64517 RepID=A0AAD5SBD8_9FUNG|nr:hypothetical protein HK097_008814 [Rhizophlyctis rosea]